MQESVAAGQNVSTLLTTFADANTVTGLTTAQAAYGFDGQGQTVVVIDSGIAYRHTALGGGYGTGYQVVGGYDFAERDNDPYDDGSAGSHGTHVAGIIGSRDASRPGVASGVDLVALRVFDDSGVGSYTWVEEALQWVHTHLNSFANPITTVNLSLGSDWNAETQPAWSTIEDELAILEADGIFISVAAGNSFSTYQTPGLSYPASSSYVVPVMSVDADGSLSYYSQRATSAIAAPGRSILSTVPDYAGNRNGIDDDFARYSGTSMAAPYVAAASVLLREAYQFVGVSSVTQDTLYNLMRSTADVIHDATTNLDYLRLNIQRALDAIMPDDDFGSTAGTAYQLGTITDTRSVSGTVANLGDHDYFRFTAAKSGRVTFTLTATGDMQTHWDVVAGGSEQTSQGSTVTMQVVAGQTYTIGLGSANGLGHYTINAQLTADASVPNESSGQQVYWRDNRVDANGQWFAFTAAQQGLVTFEASFANWQGDVDLEIFDANQRFLVGSYSENNGERIDLTAAAGQKFFVRVYVNGYEVNSDVDLRVTNLVAQVGDTVNVSGTSGSDQYTFTAGATHSLTVNGVSYSFNGSMVRQVNFNGLAGSDTATLSGTSANEEAILRPDSAELKGSRYTVRVTGVENITVNGGGGSDTAFLYDSTGNDTFTARPSEATLAGQGFSERAVGFATIIGYSTAGGTDTASLYDSTGNDSLQGTPTYTRLQGNGFLLCAKYFETVYADATAGGNDTAVLYDSRNDDTYIAKPTESTLSSSRFKIQARYFDAVQAYATAGGTDRAYLYDSTGQDVFIRRDRYSTLSGTGFSNRANDFEEVQAISSAGGEDIAYLYDSALADHLQAYGNTACVTNARYAVWAYGFDRLHAFGGQGQDRQSIAAVDYLLDLLGIWR
ncbi:MAG: S8 family serine peptidase [Thermoguttaceae bacterium]